MPTDINKAIEEYGYVGTLANSIPELKKILQQMAAKNATVEEFTRAVQDSAWWKNSADKIKQNQILKATKPGEYSAQRQQSILKIELAASKMGVSIGSHLPKLLASYMNLGWDDNELNRQLALLIDPKRQTAGGHLLGGDAGTLQQQIKKMYSDYGVKYSQMDTAIWTRRILSQTSTLATLQGNLMNNAKSRYSALAPDIDQGRTVREIADPYVQQMATTLEIPQGTLDLYDPKIQQALSIRDAKTGTSTVKPLWQFEQDLKNDPRWDKTKNAVNSAYDQAMRIGKDWGFVG